MKPQLLILAAAALVLPACSTPQTLTVTPAHGPPLTVTTGKDLQSTAKTAALSFAAWYLQQLTTRPAK